MSASSGGASNGEGKKIVKKKTSSEVEKWEKLIFSCYPHRPTQLYRDHPVFFRPETKQMHQVRRNAFSKAVHETTKEAKAILARPHTVQRIPVMVDYEGSDDDADSHESIKETLSPMEQRRVLNCVKDYLVQFCKNIYNFLPMLFPLRANNWVSYNNSEQVCMCPCHSSMEFWRKKRDMDFYDGYDGSEWKPLHKLICNNRNLYMTANCLEQHLKEKANQCIFHYAANQFFQNCKKEYPFYVEVECTKKGIRDKLPVHSDVPKEIYLSSSNGADSTSLTSDSKTAEKSAVETSSQLSSHKRKSTVISDNSSNDDKQVGVDNKARSCADDQAKSGGTKGNWNAGDWNDKGAWKSLTNATGGWGSAQPLFRNLKKTHVMR